MHEARFTTSKPSRFSAALPAVSLARLPWASTLTESEVTA